MPYRSIACAKKPPRFGPTPYLLTVGDDQRAHATAVTVEWQDDELVMSVGARSARNATARPEVSLLWPPFEPGGYSLISDGVVRDTGDEKARLCAHPCGAAPTGRRTSPAGGLHGGLRAAHDAGRRESQRQPRRAPDRGLSRLPFDLAVELEVGHALGQDRQRLLHLCPREPRAEAVVDAAAEREVRRRPTLSGDVEAQWVGKHRFVVVRGDEARRDERTLREQDVLVLDVLRGEPARAAHGAEDAHAFLGGLCRELRSLRQEAPLIWVTREQGDRARELVARRVGAADEHRDRHALEVFHVEAVSRLLHRDEVGEQIVGRTLAPPLDETLHVLPDLVLRLEDRRQLRHEVAVEEPQEVTGPPAEQPPILFGRAEQRADDRDRIGLAHIGHELAAARRRDRVDEAVDHLAHVWAQPVRGLRRERGRHEPPQARVLLAFGREDAGAPRRHPGELRDVDAQQLG